MVLRDPDTARAAEPAVNNVDGRVPGAALAVVRSAEPLFATCYGLADLEWRRPVTPTTVFRLASLSKPFLALTIMLLEQDGLLACTLRYPIGWVTGYRTAPTVLR
jgi:CubicO group peptidase (beta-lactamase class C family)